jgi:rare lipoprotein A
LRRPSERSPTESRTGADDVGNTVPAAGLRRMTFRVPFLALLCAAGGCAETQLATHAIKKGNRELYGQPMQDVQLQPVSAPATAPVSPRSYSLYKVGDPYQIDGTWYYPKEDYSYSETGIASWYGDEFHGKPTANGEPYDQHTVSAAHRTLPLPSMVRVTNLENGRSMVVRINDRGPFARGRIIDMSRRGAEALGFYGQGTAKVRVEVLAAESRQMKEAALRGQRINPIQLASATPTVPAETPGKPQLIAVSAHPQDPPIEPRVKLVPVGQTNIFVQAGAFAKYDNAVKVRDALTPVAATAILPVTRPDARLYRVRVGPLASVADADDALERVVKRGYPDARIIVE